MTDDEVSMAQEDVRDMIDLLQGQEDYYVFQIMCKMLTDEWRETAFTDECKQCQGELLDGHEIFIWGEPLNEKNPKDSKHVGLANFCSEKCFGAYSEEWAKRHNFLEYATVFYR